MVARSVAERVRLWDAALAGIRAHFRAHQLREVLTPVRLPAVALEPFIEPLPVAGGLLATSPELPMKMLLARGSGSLFQIAQCHRKGERGRLHAEGFHLVEWYREGDDGTAVRRDVEAIVAIAFEAAGRDAVPAWQHHGILDLVQATVGLSLRGDETGEALGAIVGGRRPDLWIRPRGADEETRTLAAWTGFFTQWSDVALDPWLRSRSGVHVGDFPIALAALSDLGVPVTTRGRAGTLAHRCESYVNGIELANAYRELRDPVEQRRRFEIVARLRDAHLQPALPMPEGFLQTLEQPGLPACAGAALGLERLLMIAAGANAVQDIAP